MDPDVIAADPVAAQPEAPTGPSFEDTFKTWTAEERRVWATEGTEPAPKPAKVQTPAEKPEEIPSAKETVPDSDPGEEEQEEPTFTGTPDQIKAQRKAFSTLRRNNAELKARLRLLEEQKAEPKAAVPAAAPKTEAPKPTERPKRPRLDQYESVADYETAMDGYEEAREAWDQKKFERVRESATEELTQKQVAERWESEKDEMREAHPDFDEVAFSPKVPASDVMIGVLTSTKGGARVLYGLGQDPKQALELAQATHIPGYADYAALSKAAESDPRLARKLGEAEGLVRQAVNRIVKGSKTPPPAPQPKTVSTALPPATRVSSVSSAPVDPVQDAYDKGDFGKAARLEAARDRDARIKQRA